LNQARSILSDRPLRIDLKSDAPELACDLKDKGFAAHKNIRILC
jgi:hypothetical protein